VAVLEKIRGEVWEKNPMHLRARRRRNSAEAWSVRFTNGIAILIASTQIRDFFGLQMERVPGDFFRSHGRDC
jgi:hypothetical protein